ncbi:MAG: F0F1 ATP synthase subunit B [Rhodospirillales bacterium]|nr:F0F1 ATP synthase subunit B [Rhodospirillales bacterium]
MLQDPTFWVATAFVAFILVLIYLKVPGSVGAQLDKRADKIKADLEEAEALFKEAQDLLSTYQKKQREAAREAEAIAEHAREEAQRMLEQVRQRLNETLARRLQLAKDRISQAETAAIDDVRVRTVNIAMDATREIMAKGLVTAKANAMIDAAIKELPSKIH